MDDRRCDPFRQSLCAPRRSQPSRGAARRWALASAAFGETYHFSALHRNTLAADFYGNVQLYDTYGRNHRMTLCMKSIDTMRGKPKQDWNLLQGTLPVYYLFPNVQLLLSAAGPTLVRIYPDGPNPHQSRSKVDFYFPPEALESDFARGIAASQGISVRELFAMRMESFARVIEAEDYVVAASGHRGARAGASEFVLFGRNEPALHHYHNTYREALGLPPLEAVEAR